MLYILSEYSMRSVLRRCPKAAGRKTGGQYGYMPPTRTNALHLGRRYTLQKFNLNNRICILNVSLSYYSTVISLPRFILPVLLGPIPFNFILQRFYSIIFSMHYKRSMGNPLTVNTRLCNSLPEHSDTPPRELRQCAWLPAASFVYFPSKL